MSDSSLDSDHDKDEGSPKRRKVLKNPKTMNQLLKSRSALLEDAFGYKAKENPFGDEELNAPFIWEPRVVQQRTEGIDVKTTTDAYLETTLDKVAEIEDVRRRRKQREKEEDERDDERAQIARDKAHEKYDELLEREQRFSEDILLEKFSYGMANGREAEPHLLVKSFLLNFKDHLTLNDMRPGSLFDEYKKIYKDMEYRPLTFKLVPDSIPSYFNGMAVTDLHMVRGDLNKLHKITVDRCNTRSTKDSRVREQIGQVTDGPTLWNPLDDISAWPPIVQNRFAEYLKALITLVNYAIRDKTTGTTVEVSAEIRLEVAEFLSGQTEEELTELRHMVKEMVDTGGGDTNYWESIQDLIPYYICRSVADSVHNGALTIVAALEESRVRLSSVKRLQAEQKMEMKKELTVKEMYKKENDGDDLELKTVPLKELSDKQLDNILTLEEFNITIKRNQNSQLVEYIKANRGMLENKVKVLIESPRHTKLKVRKPRFQNNVKTGYDWNRYNQAHYDVDNPPPRRVQGYKFNIYYPDLYDKTITPHWVLEPSALEGTVIIRFSAGPPYEDIAFRIVNRDWDTKPHNGYRNVFDKGVLQLHFNLKRLRYRK